MIGTWPLTVSISGTPLLANGGAMMASAPSSSSSWAARWAADGSSGSSLTMYSTSWPPTPPASLSRSTWTPRRLRPGHVGEAADVAEVGGVADGQRFVERAVAARGARGGRRAARGRDAAGGRQDRRWSPARPWLRRLRWSRPRRRRWWPRPRRRRRRHRRRRRPRARRRSRVCNALCVLRMSPSSPGGPRLQRRPWSFGPEQFDSV